MPQASLTVSIPDALDAFIREQVAAGRYASAEDVVREALALLSHREQERGAVLDVIRQEIQLGIDQADAGSLRDGETAFREVRSKLGIQ